MGGLLQAELLKLRKRPAVWVLLAILAVTLALFVYFLPYVFLSIAEPHPDAELWREGQPLTPLEFRALFLPRNFVFQALMGLAALGGAVGLIVGVLAAGSEYRWGTVRTLAIQGPSRLAVGGGKVGGLALVLLGFVVVTFSVALGCSVVIAVREGAPLAFPPVGTVLTGLGTGWLILFAWGAFGTFLAVALRGTGLAVGLGLVYSLLIEPLATGLPLPVSVVEALRSALLGPVSHALVMNFVPVRLGDLPVPAWQAALVLAGYAALFLVLAGLMFRRRDIT
ncbi:TPA: ABC transporter permease [Candidatus Acetothermia bacterium]|nr:ABC transporter permease [Candidatus Acetothermia bacterium]